MPFCHFCQPTWGCLYRKRTHPHSCLLTNILELGWEFSEAPVAHLGPLLEGGNSPPCHSPPWSSVWEEEFLRLPPAHQRTAGSGRHPWWSMAWWGLWVGKSNPHAHHCLKSFRCQGRAAEAPLSHWSCPGLGEGWLKILSVAEVFLVQGEGSQVSPRLQKPIIFLEHKKLCLNSYNVHFLAFKQNQWSLTLYIFIYPFIIKKESEANICWLFLY